MNNAKINAARRLVATLNTAFDFEWFLLDHPNEGRAMDRLIREVTRKDHTMSTMVGAAASSYDFQIILWAWQHQGVVICQYNFAQLHAPRRAIYI